jgi:hypothetical protein
MSANPVPQRAPLPPEIDRWSWGAFLLNWIWGLGNNTLIALLALVPFVGIVMMFVLGAKGNEWAWRNKSWESVEQFKRVQRNWAVAGVIAWIALIALFAAFFFGAMALLKGSDVFRDALTKVNANAQAVRLLGTPIEAGFPMGNISVSGPSGQARLSIPLHGPKGKATLYLEATKQMGVWQFERIQLEIDATGERIDIQDSPPRRLETVRGFPPTGNRA